MATKTKSQEAANDVVALLRARNPLLWIVTREEARVEGYLMKAAIAAKYAPRTWDVAAGVRELDGSASKLTTSKGPDEILAFIQDCAEKKDAPDAQKVRTAWILRDLPPWITGGIGMSTLRQLRNVVRVLPSTAPNRAQVMIVISPSGDVPPELSTQATVIEWPLPDRAEIELVLDAAINPVIDEPANKLTLGDVLPDEDRSQAIDAAIGLSGEEAASCYARSLVQLRTISPVLVAKEKKRVIARERVLEWHDPLPGGLDAIGGLGNIKSWLMTRAIAWTPEARAYGLPSPRGLFLIGVSGCGKSLTAKAAATALGCPLLRLDLGVLKNEFVGGSEALLRKALRVIESVGRCVLWIDEIEKGLAGATGGGADGGVSMDQLGAILSWMQERTCEAFVIATANDISKLPPELYRKGRFDDIFFVDLPTPEERGAVLSAALRAHGRDLKKLKVDLPKVITVCDNFTGAEIAALVPEAMFAAFADKGREIGTVDLITAAKTVVPLATTAEEKLRELRDWAKKRARPATAVHVEKVERRREGRVLDLGVE